MKTVMSTLNREEACQFVDACSDWLAKTLCDTAFTLWRCSYNCVSKGVMQPVVVTRPRMRRILLNP